MRRKKTMKVMVYLMVISMLLSSLLAGVSFLF
ncbi:stressosome-associated protein Prli42 [Bacillus solimangrovi]|nr:stressosome-associated protein Prli42 [Bacillus solimangrovi]